MTVYRWKNYDRYKSEVNQVREYYDAVHRCHRLALESLLSDQADCALDIACGHGESTCILEPFAKSIVGVDSSEDLIDIAKQQNKHADTNYICTPFNEFQAPEQSFDIISSAWYLNHVLTIEELEKAIDKVARLLKRGGGIAFVVPGSSFTTQRIQEIARRDFQWRQAWTHERPESTEGVFSFDGNWIQTRVWQPFFLMKFMSEWFDIHAWDVKGTLVTEGLLQNLVCEPPFEVLYGYRR